MADRLLPLASISEIEFCSIGSVDPALSLHLLPHDRATTRRVLHHYRCLTASLHIVQALQQAVLLYCTAAAGAEDGDPSAAEAGTASLRLATLYDNLLKVPSFCSIPFMLHGLPYTIRASIPLYR